MKTIIIFGAGIRGKRALEIARHLGVNVSCLSDNDPAKWNGNLNGVPIISPDELERYPDNNPVFIANKFAEAEIKKQLQDMGITDIYNIEDIYFWNRITYLGNENILSYELRGTCISPYVSIIISSTYKEGANLQNNYECQVCLDSIRKSRISVPYEIIVWGDTVPIPRGDVVILLDDSAMIQEGAIDYLLQQFQGYSGNCIVGSKTIDDNDSIVQAGYILWKNHTCEAYGFGCFWGEPEYEYVREVDILSRNGMLFSIHHWNTYIQSVETFGNSFEAEVDYCLTMKAQGIPLVFQPLSLIMEKRKSCDYQKLINLDNAKLWLKWELFCEKECFDEEGEERLDIVNRKEHKFIMLLADASVAEYDTNAGHRSTYNYLKIFLSMGARIIYLVDNMLYSDKYTVFFQQMGILVTYGRRWDERRMFLLGGYLDQIQYAFLNRPQVALKYIHLLKQNPNMITAHYGHDLHFMRLEREYKITGDVNILEDAKAIKEKELGLITQVDHTGYPSEVEVDVLKRFFPQSHIEYFPLYYFKEYNRKNRKKNTEGILFVGGFAHRPNEDAAIWLINEIIPLIRQKGINDKVFLVGSKPSEEILKLQRPDVIVTGYVTDEELQKFYEDCKVAVVPLRFGAGMKGKVLEAMYYGIPLITTDIGAEGLWDIDDILGIGNDKKGISEKMIEIYSNRELEETISYKEYSYIINNFGKKQIQDIIFNHIKSILS